MPEFWQLAAGAVLLLRDIPITLLRLDSGIASRNVGPSRFRAMFPSPIHPSHLTFEAQETVFAARNKSSSAEVRITVDNPRPLPRIAGEAEPSKLSEQWIALIVITGGGKYVGLLQGIPGRIEAVVLFVSPRTRTTLGLPVSGLSVEAVRECIAKSDEAFAQGRSYRKE